jgi:formyltetrahydrofolate synthetase
MPNEDGFTIGELRRLQERSLSEHGDINRRIDAVQREFLRRETFEIALGSIRMEITAMASDVKDVTEQLRVMKEQADQRARTMLALVVSAFVAPIVTALIVFWLTSGGTH